MSTWCGLAVSSFCFVEMCLIVCFWRRSRRWAMSSSRHVCLDPLLRPSSSTCTTQFCPRCFCDSFFYSAPSSFTSHALPLHHILFPLLLPYLQTSVHTYCSICVQVMSPKTTPAVVTATEVIARARAGSRSGPPAPRSGDGLGRMHINEPDVSVQSQSTLSPLPSVVCI